MRINKTFFVIVIMMVLCIPINLIPAELPPQIFFDKDVLGQLINIIKQAKSSIYVEVFEYTQYKNIEGEIDYDEDITRPLTDMLILKSKELGSGNVQFIIDVMPDCNPDLKELNEKDGHWHWVGTPEKELEDAGCIVRWARYGFKKGYFHRKLAIIDKEYVVCGSTNWTRGGFVSNNEATLFIHDRVTGEVVYQEFCKDWEHASDLFKPLANP